MIPETYDFSTDGQGKGHFSLIFSFILLPTIRIQTRLKAPRREDSREAIGRELGVECFV